MEFNESLKQFAERVENLKGTISTEEGTKMSLIVPMFQLLGYDVFNRILSRIYCRCRNQKGGKSGLCNFRGWQTCYFNRV